MRNFSTKLLVLGLALSFALPAMARDNDDYGETRFNSLPLSGMVSKNVWVGSWWAYRTDGSAYRLHDPNTSSWSYKTDWTRWDSNETAHLSPSEKYDLLVGRLDKVEYDKLIERGKKVDELSIAMKDNIEERRELIYTLNKMIRENKGDSTFNWPDTDEGKRYKEVSKSIEDAEKTLSDITVTIDTVTEYEILMHGTMQFGVESWFGHCNAWAAAAIMEPEPRVETTVDGITFTAGDVKAYVTEAWMEIQSSFHGSRNGRHKTAEDREAVDYQDMTPAGFHILFADQVGNRDKSFVIDRFTGSEVWNQPVKAYRAKCEPLYTDDTAMDRNVTYTSYGYRGAQTNERGTQQVFPVLCTTTIHWITDGLPHETLTVEHIANDIDDDTFANSHRIEQLYNDQVELRTLTYELWLDKPMTEADARLVGDGVWDHGSATGYEHLHPDFVWQPQANVNDRNRDYENELYDYKLIVDRILPGTLKPADNPTVEPTEFAATGAVEIPDYDTVTGAALTVEVPNALTIGTMAVDVDITHTYIGDLAVSLVHPSGKSVTLKPNGEGRSDHDIVKTYDVKDFDGMDAQGVWTLQVYDHWQRDVGTINGLTLHLK